MRACRVVCVEQMSCVKIVATRDVRRGDVSMAHVWWRQSRQTVFSSRLRRSSRPLTLQ